MSTELGFEKRSFNGRMRSMMKADFRRMFTSRLFYIMTGIALFVPILIIVMTSMTAGSVTVDPNTGEETVMEAFGNTWQIVGTVSGESSSTSMDMTSMCNMNLVYFAAVVLDCLFIAEDFRSGYAKNLFTVRAKRNEYIYSKLILFFICGVIMALAFFVGAVLGGKISGLPFTMDGFNAFNLVMCLIAKLGIVAVFAPISILAAVFAKQRAWLGLLIGGFGGMLLYMTIPMMTPLNATVMHAFMCLAGGAIFSVGLGAAGTLLLKRRDLV